MPLTDIKCKQAKPIDKAYKLTDGGGLFRPFFRWLRESR